MICPPQPLHLPLPPSSVIHSFTQQGFVGHRLCASHREPHTMRHSRICNTWTLSATPCLPVCAFKSPMPPSSLSSLPSLPGNLPILQDTGQVLPTPPLRTSLTPRQRWPLCISVPSMPTPLLWLHATWHLLVHISLFSSTLLTPWGRGFPCLIHLRSLTPLSIEAKK